MEDSQLFGKTDPTLLKWLNNIISSNLKTKFKMQTSTTCISISGKQWDERNWSSDLFWTQTPSRPFSSCYLVFSSLKRGPEEDPFYQVTGKIKYLKGTFIVKNGTNIRKEVPWLHLKNVMSSYRESPEPGSNHNLAFSHQQEMCATFPPPINLLNESGQVLKPLLPQVF